MATVFGGELAAAPGVVVDGNHVVLRETDHLTAPKDSLLPLEIHEAECCVVV